MPHEETVLTNIDNFLVNGDDNTVQEPMSSILPVEVKYPAPKVKPMAKRKSIKKSKKPTLHKNKLMKNSKPKEKRVFTKGGGIFNKTQVMRLAIFRNFASHYCTEFRELE